MQTAISAIQGLSAYCKTYINLDRHVARNARLVNAIQNLCLTSDACLSRLLLRASQLHSKGAQDPTQPILASLALDFSSALKWLQSNDRLLKSRSGALIAAQQVEELDKRISLAFAKKVSFAILETLQETHATTQPINYKIDRLAEDLPALVESRIMNSNVETIKQALEILKEEERAIKPGPAGFHNNEAEKVISSLIDAVADREAELQFIKTANPPFQPASTPNPPTHRTPYHRSLSEPIADPSGVRVAEFPAPSRAATWSIPEPTDPAPMAPSVGLLGVPNGHRSRSGSRSGTKDTNSRPPSQSTGLAPSTDSFNMQSLISNLTMSESFDDVIGFKSIDATTNKPIIDPVLCSDNLIHCRWDVIFPTHDDPTTSPSTSVRKLLRNLTILGDVEQLRSAIFQMYPDRKQEYHLRRQSFRDQCLLLCGPEGHTRLQSLVWHLSHVLSWEPRHTSVNWLVRRAVAYFRLRDLGPALVDLDKAISISANRRGRLDIDALRYRALVRHMCHDIDGAQEDVDEILKHQQKPDPLAYALRANIKASQGLIDGALADIDRIPAALNSAPKWQSDVALENVDLVYLMTGWAKASVGHFDEAIEDFNTALHQRLSVEPYALASRGLAQIVSGAWEAGEASLREAFEETTTQSPGSGANEEQRPATFELYQLRGMARFYQSRHQEALDDMERALAQRPPEVRDTGEFRFTMACIRASLGDMVQATADCDWACALKPSQREGYKAQLQCVD